MGQDKNFSQGDNKDNWEVIHPCIPWVGTPILGHGWEVPWGWPLFWGFLIRLGPYFIPQHNLIDPLFLQEKSVCLSHLVPEILGPKFGLIFHPNELFYIFKAFCINFPLIFDQIDPFFLLILNLCDTSFSQNLRSDWVQKTFHVLNPGTENLIKSPPPFVSQISV